ncbi:DUF6461 domain-containing protein [Streptomyces sp. GXMU-J15]|uniref:DUF6461 domain-containing protein n=1 Tax=Streptomyces fuscus TaxID=3048495 RepID=A0ABT7JBH4_9ACTN|nr:MULTISPECIES: DUF6461 domain-containing protein [Streptomyces]MDL2082204.1 DUF6461 domain-containing protein [Streptomyces fuscus]
MSDGVNWLLDSYSEGFCVAFCEGVTQEEFIRRIGGDPAHTLMLTRAQAEAINLAGRYPEMSDLEYYDLDDDELRESGFMEPGAEIVRTGRISEWAFAIQSFGAFLSESQIARQGSHGTRYVSFGRTVNMAAWVQYAIDGELMNSFDPLHPPRGRSLAGLQINELGNSDDPASAVLAHLEERFHIAIPIDADEQSLLTISLRR